MKTRFIITAILLCIASSVTLSSCNSTSWSYKSTKGNGDIVSKEIAITDYSKIELSSIANLVYEQKTDEAPYLRVEIDSNLLDKILIEVKNNTLHIGSEPKTNIRTEKYKVYTNSPQLAALSVSGTGNTLLKGNIESDNLKLNVSGVGNINTENLKTQNLSVSLSGVAKITLKGKSINATYSASGSGSINAKEMIVQNVKCESSGVGSIEVYASEKLDASLSGVGSIKYKGEPKIVNKSKSGIGSISSL